MDNQGHKKDKEQEQGMQKAADTNAHNQSPIDYFSQDQSFVYVYKKTEKLATALYMVTNLFGDSEPMKWALRTKVSHLLSFIIGFKDILESREYEFSNEVKTRVLEVVSLLEVASRSGLVSPMNFSIVKTEFMSLVASLAALKKDSSEGTHFAFPKTFFEVPGGTPHANPLSSQHSHAAFAGGHSKSQAPAFKDTLPIKDALAEGSSFKKTNRQSIIINLLKKKKDLTIKDIAQVIRDCSEKTIQRELIALIEAGVLKKTGERRWSRYSLIQA